MFVLVIKAKLFEGEALALKFLGDVDGAWTPLHTSALILPAFFRKHFGRVGHSYKSRFDVLNKDASSVL